MLILGTLTFEEAERRAYANGNHRLAAILRAGPEEAERVNAELLQEQFELGYDQGNKDALTP